MSRWVSMTALACCLALSGREQARPAFEVVSVKPATEATRSMGITLYVYAGGRIRATNYRIRGFIHDAYGIEDWRVIGGPAWLDEDRFDIEGKPAAGGDLANWVPVSFKTPPNAEMRLMMQSLLADRFHLKVHTENRKESVYALVAVKGGHRLKAPADGTVQPFVSFMQDGLRGQNATVDQLAERLASLLKRPVLNRTGIPGNFDFRIQYPAEDIANNDEATLLLGALPEQCGLKLETEPGSAEYLVIDNVQRPLGN